MIKLQDLQIGDFVLADFDGQQREGTVTDFNRLAKEVCIETDVQEFWFKPDVLHPIPLNEQQLLKLNFEKEDKEDNTVKYKKGAFRVLLPEKNNFSKIEIWYREDRRVLNQPLSVHELQNHYLQMTKIPLSRN